MRGQILSVDFVFSLIVFTFILTTSVLIWNNVNSQIDQNERNNKVQSELSSISTILIESAGSPNNWEVLDSSQISQINQIGLALKSNVLSPAKINALTVLPYIERDLLGLETGNVYIEFVDSDGNLLIDAGNELKFGSPPQNSENIYRISRAVLIDDARKPIIGIMNVIIW